ncbi:MAG: hypothetical protein K6U89_03745 [Chloroflexi bacterium]|nr:hypothetical protein [Chloroflexota bacterium]GIW11290.1 MAG: hypothetical protein KatS3mg061_2347 [Dehalococcoidia bacterium]
MSDPHPEGPRVAEWQATLDAFFQALAQQQAERAYALLATPFRRLFSLPVFRDYLQQEQRLVGYRACQVRSSAPLTVPDRALIELAHFGDAAPGPVWENEALFERYRQAPQIAVAGEITFADGRVAWFEVGLVAEAEGWRVRGYHLEHKERSRQ